MVEPGVYLEHFVDRAREYLRDASKANYLAVLSANQTNDRIFTNAVDLVTPLRIVLKYAL